jgi:hypothetical protein
MISHRRACLPYLLAVSVATTASVDHAQARPTSAAQDGIVAVARPSLTIESPTPGELVQGVAIIRFHTGNVSIESPFLPAELRRGPLPAAHLHVTVDGAAWHWMHTSSDPVVVTPLPPGQHTVTLELAGADHRPLETRTVRFTIVARVTPASATPRIADVPPPRRTRE